MPTSADGPSLPRSCRKASCSASPPKSSSSPTATTRLHSEARHRKESSIQSAASTANPSDSGALESNANIEASAVNDTLLSAASLSFRRTGNPTVRAIQSRVADLVRRFDESLADNRDWIEDDSEGVDVPSRWRVGDVLLATHTALTRTGARTERTMASEFTEDAEVSLTLDHAQSGLDRVLTDAGRQVEQVRQVIAKSMRMMKQLEESDVLSRLAIEASDVNATATRMREMKIALDALHKEKSMILAQLQEQVRSHKEMITVTEELDQELKQAQIALGLKNDELKALRDELSSRTAEAQKIAETAQQNVGTWRDKCQSTAKALTTAEQKIAELEAKVRTQAGELAQHEFVLQAKNLEAEKHRERLRESEALRMKAEAIATATARSEEDARLKKAADEAAHLSKQERLDLEARVRQQELQIRELQTKLRDQSDSQSRFARDNQELTALIRGLEKRVQDPAGGNARIPQPPLRRASSLTLSLKRDRTRPTEGDPKTTARSSRSRRSSRQSSARDDDDDLSTDSSEAEEEDADSECERDEAELNEAVQQVVTSVFAERVSQVPQSDEAIRSSIDLFEEPGRQAKQSAMLFSIDKMQAGSKTEVAVVATGAESAESRSEGQDQEHLPPITLPSGAASAVSSKPSSAGRTPASAPNARSDLSPSSSANASTASATTARSSSDDMQRMQQDYEEQIARLKQQYVAGLLEYKKLVIEQYERRQTEIQRRHRLEIENLLLLVQDKFKKELERRGEKLLQAKESLKLLYRALQVERLQATSQSETPARSRASTVTALEPIASPPSPHSEPEEDESDAPPEADVPLRSLLRAAVFALSSSKRRNEQAIQQLQSIYEHVKLKRAARAARRYLTKPASTRPTSPNGDSSGAPPSRGQFIRQSYGAASATSSNEGTAQSSCADVACQVEETDFAIFGLKGLRDNCVAPENVEAYVVSSTACVSPRIPGMPQRGVVGGVHLESPRRPRTPQFSLAEGAAFSVDTVRDLRALLPSLPPGCYFLSKDLRLALLQQLCVFFSCHAAALRERERDGNDDDAARADDGEAVVFVGSPRDTPFLRRKAVEGLQKQRFQRRRALLQ